MGAEESQVVETPIILLHSNFTQVNAIKEKNKQTLRGLLISDSLSYNSWVKQLESSHINNLDQQFLFWPQKHQFNSVNACCATKGTVTIDYEYYPFVLSEQIKFRGERGLYFLEPELWYLLFALIKAKEALKQDKGLIGDIQENNIFLNRQKKIKIANKFSWPNQQNNYKKTLMSDEITYLAPEDLLKMKQRLKNNQSTSQTSEIFSIGLTLLGSALLKSNKDLYLINSKKQLKFDQNQLQNRLKQFQKTEKYSMLFRSLVTNLVSIDASQRLKLNDLENMLEPHFQNIKKRKQLKFTFLPEVIFKKFIEISDDQVKSVSNQQKVQQSKIDIRIDQNRDLKKTQNKTIQVKSAILPHKIEDNKIIIQKNIPFIQSKNQKQTNLNKKQNRFSIFQKQKKQVKANQATTAHKVSTVHPQNPIKEIPPQIIAGLRETAKKNNHFHQATLLESKVQEIIVNKDNPKESNDSIKRSFMQAEKKRQQEPIQRQILISTSQLNFQNPQSNSKINYSYFKDQQKSKQNFYQIKDISLINNLKDYERSSIQRVPPNIKQTQSQIVSQETQRISGQFAPFVRIWDTKNLNAQRSSNAPISSNIFMKGEKKVYEVKQI